MAKTAGEVRAGTMWAKSREKKAMGKYHTRNFGMGHVEADLHYLTRAELRGRKRWLLFSAVLLGYLLVIGHLLVTCTILGVLRFDATGPPYFEFNNDGSLRWPEGAQLSEVRLDSSLQAFSNQSLTVTGGDTQQVIFKSGSQRFSAASNSFINSSQVSLSPSETRLSPLRSFVVTHSNHQLLFANSSHVIMEGVSSLHHLQATTGLTTTNVRAETDDMSVNSDSGSLTLLGGGGVSLIGAHFNISSGQDLELFTALSGSIIIGGREGVKLQGLPVTPSLTPSSPHHHLCVCGTTRRLFLVPSNPLRCAPAVQNTEHICDA